MSRNLLPCITSSNHQHQGFSSKYYCSFIISSRIIVKTIRRRNKQISVIGDRQTQKGMTII